MTLEVVITTEMLLAGLLPVAVPLRIEEIRHWDWERRSARMIEGSDLLSGPGAEHLLFRGKRTAEMFTVLVDMLACGSYQPGGVPFAGIVFCAKHGVSYAYPCEAC